MRRMLAIVVLLFVIPGVASAGGGGDISMCPGFSSGGNVSMLDSCFNGVAHFAPTGRVTVVNDGELPHTFTAVNGAFDSGTLEPGGVFEIDIDEPAIIEVFCSLHGTADGSGMAGVLVVGEAEPSPVLATIDVSAIKQAVSEETQTLEDSVALATQAIGNLSAAQASLRRGLEDDTEVVAAPAPTIVTVPVETSTNPPWVPLVAGVAAGLAVAALFVAHRPQRRETETGPSNRPTGMVVPIEES